MNKNVLIIHRILYSINFVIWLSSIVFFLYHLKTLPDVIGVHFDHYGNFDVFASKYYGFYPHIIGGLILIAMTIAFITIRKKNSGLRISDKGEAIFKAELIITLELILMLCLLFFVFWTLSVSLQVPLNTTIIRNELLLIFIIAFWGIISEIITFNIHKEKSVKKKNKFLFHRVTRIISWLITLGGVWMLAESWNRFPGNEELYYNPDYFGLAFFANFNEYMSKKLLLIPQITIFLLLSTLECIAIIAMNRQIIPLVKLSDDLKLISCLFFFYWNMQLCSELRIGIISVSLYIILCIISFILFFVRRKKITNTIS